MLLDRTTLVYLLRDVSQLVIGRNKLNFMRVREDALQYEMIVKLNIFIASMKNHIEIDVEGAEVVQHKVAGIATEICNSRIR